MTAITTTQQTYQSAIEYVEALQWTGDNLRQLQDFLLPGSPLLDGAGSSGVGQPATSTLLINVLDEKNIRLYPSLGRQVTTAAVAVGDWIVRQVGASVTGDPADLQVIKVEEFERRFRPVGNCAGAPLTGPDGGAGWMGVDWAQPTHPRVLMAGGDGGPGTQMTTTQQADLAGER